MGKKKMQKRLSFHGLKLIMIGVFLLAGMALLAGQGLAAVIDIGADGIFVEAGIDQASSLELRVAGPGGFHEVRQSVTGSLEWNLPATLADGEYRYEIFILVGDKPEKGEDVKDNRELQYGNGRFVVEGGVISPEKDATPPTAPDKHSLVPSESWLMRIVQIVGDFLVPSAQADDLIASSSDPTVYFNDSSVAGNEWHFLGTTDFFRLYDDEFDKQPFYTEDNPSFGIWIFDHEFLFHNFKSEVNSIYLHEDCGAVLRAYANGNIELADGAVFADANGDIELADGALFIDKLAGNLGIGTITPTEDLHIVDDIPGILLDDTAGGDIHIYQSAGEVSFVRYNSDHNGEILTLENDLSSTLYPGLGIWEINPKAPLHVGSHDEMSGKILVKNPTAPSAAGDVEMFALENAGNKIVRFKILAGGGYSIWTFDNEPTYNGAAGFHSGRFRISKSGTGDAEFSVDGFGNGIFFGTSSATQHINTSARDAKTDFQPLNEEEILEKVMRLPVSQWRYKQEDPDERHIGPVAEDFQAIFGLGDGKHISTVDSEGIALAAIKAIKTEKDAEITALKADNDAAIVALKEENRVLFERLNALEELVLGRQKVTQLMQ